MGRELGAAGLVVGMLIGVVTAPVGVSGVVFLFPVQLGVFTVPNPAVTPTNLLYNVVAVLMLPLGGHLAHRPDPASCAPEGPMSRARAPGGHRPGAGGRGCGRYGIGGGSIPGPVLVGRGVPVSQVAPAALASTFATSVVGASTYAVLSLARSGSIAPVWLLGLACGFGGLIGGCVGTRLQPCMPETFLLLRLLLGALAAVLGAVASFTSSSRVCLPVWAAVCDLEAHGFSREIAAAHGAVRCP